MKVKFYWAMALVILLNGCKATKPVGEEVTDKPVVKSTELTISELCQPLTFSCHETQKQRAYTKDVWAGVAKTHTFVTDHDALFMLNELKANTQLDKALIHKRKAEIKNRMGNYKASLQDNLKAQSLDVLPARIYLSLLLLEIRTRFVLEEFDSTKSRANSLWQYLERPYHPEVATILGFIAKKKGNSAEYDKWVSLIKQNETEARASQLLGVLAGEPDKHQEEEEESAPVYKSTGKYPKELPKFEKVTRGPNAPKVIYRREPRYPAQAARYDTEGKVAMTFDVNTKGQPVNIKVVYAYPEGLFEEAGVESLEKWRFEVQLDGSGEVIDGKDFYLVLAWAVD
ncbi:TonB family protein [Pseudoalteromonas sp. SMS1]|uniref:TonB family protein n=1 Tax=Pseudoalteromonas sp. SMS1 TaxID=2908894 RepID=UPI001F3C99FD|nr:TonB family protein [Pseudoalteromonas sp. SMS1]MCF2859210.1 TonB family protein [Pseudoalteromonas sp. SMS1]